MRAALSPSLQVCQFSLSEWLRGLWAQNAQVRITQYSYSRIFYLPNWRNSPHFATLSGVLGGWAVWIPPMQIRTPVEGRGWGWASVTLFPTVLCIFPHFVNVSFHCTAHITQIVLVPAGTLTDTAPVPQGTHLERG